MVTILVAALAALSACGSSTSALRSTAARQSAASGAAANQGATTSAASTSSPARARRHARRRRRRRRVANPGRLPQTHVLPQSNTRAFHSEMADLWRGIQADATRIALPAFFPVDAYTRLKTLGDPRGDWRSRLVGDFGLDITAAHDLLGPGARRDRLVEVLVPEQFAHWVSPGVCDNGIGYYEVPNARIVYRGPSGLASFGIASMISWRGVWYVVHLGEVLRPTVTGVVDDPGPGPGTSAFSATC
jgi:hypothetical protein